MSRSRVTPVSLRGRLQRLLWQLPPVQLADQRLQEVETGVLQNLTQRLAELDENGQVQHEDIHALLESSLELNLPQAEQLLVQQLLDSLTPDEARILSALSDGSAFPLLTLYAGGGLLQRGNVLHRYSNVGRASGVQCNPFVPFYLARLFAQGLVVSMPAKAEMRTDYELCEGDAAYRKAFEQLQAHNPKIRMVRETLIASPMARALWALMLADNEPQGDSQP
ncbi:MAG: hypothetical protein R3292_06350 [Alcanivorax sp.]|nr:hypothetical protein [Alcanivorax sp.]